ncbi:helix-turn-helix domain-containing protein [Leucobacter sp. Z1108]|uniref:helix-turn-helix domain-containing protein n=1 Tax=Leucobacter sp. Z1108 TaxID=3439066 RepID=UPI003F366F6C
MNESWTVSRLAHAVQISRNQLTRQFVTQVGAPPMRYLTSIRLVEFTRLIDETDLSVEQAARTVGWTDPRVAAAWFTRRFGMTPSHYRLRPHRRAIASHICVACRDMQRHFSGQVLR